jgi:hypothetical protein
MEFKYIMMNDGNRDIPFIFPKQVAHISMYTAMRGLEENITRPVFWTLVSAGFVNIMSCACWGESESLKDICPGTYKSRPEHDSLIIMLYQWQNGVLDPISALMLLRALKEGK